MSKLRTIAVETPGREGFPVLDPVLAKLNDSDKFEKLVFNWGLIQREMRKYGVDITTKVKEALIDGHHEIMREILRFLMNFEKKCVKEKK